VYAESGGVPLVEYVIEVSYALLGEDVSVTLEATGYLSDGTTQLDFDLSQTATINTTTEMIALDVTYQLAVGQEASVTLNINGEFGFVMEGSPETATVTLTAHHGSDHVELTATLSSDNTLDGVINYNGAPAIFIGGTEADPVFTKADESPLTPADIEALSDFFEMIGDIFEFAEHIFEAFGGGVMV
jgi:hypothetical protein